MRFFKTLRKKKNVIAGLVSASMLFSSVPVTLLANNDDDDATLVTEPTVIEFVEESQEPTTEPVEEVVETVADENVTSIPEDETEPSSEVTEPVEEPPKTEETVVETSETEETTTIVEETTTQETSEVVETTTEETTTETTVVEEPSTVNIVMAESADEFISLLQNLSDSKRLIVETEDTLDIENADGVYFDGVYILSFTDDASYNDAIANFEANGIIYSVDGNLTVNGTAFALQNVRKSNGGKRVAVIDTGSNNANEYYSVIGDDTSDGNGHGTAMCNTIYADTDAYIISIKALGNNGKGSITDVYAAVQKANELNVDYILLSMSVRDLGNYEAFHSLIEDTIANGTKVVASAGNNNRDASLYMPANISGVFTVGALNEDLTKLDVSNYGSVVDFYVVASSTSEAAAKYIALEGTDAVYTEYKTEADITPTPETTVTPIPSGSDIITFSDGTVLREIKTDEGYTYEVISMGSEFETTALGVPKLGPGGLAGYENEWNKKVTWPSNVTVSTSTSGTDTGTATMNHVSGGLGYASNIRSNSSSAYKLDSFITNWLYAECTCHRVSSSDDDIYNSQHAFSIPDGATVNYTANWRTTKSGNTTTINWTVYFYTSDTLSARTWTRVPAVGSNPGSNYPNSRSNRYSVYGTTSSVPGNSNIRSVKFTLRGPGIDGEITLFTDTYNANTSTYTFNDAKKQQVLDAASTRARRAANIGEYTGNKDYVLDAVTSSGSWYIDDGLDGFIKSVYVYDHYWHTSQSQVYIGAIYSDITKAPTGDMISVRRFAKNNSAFTYSIAYRGNGATPAASAQTYPGTWPTMPGSVRNGTITFSGEYELGWYYIPLNLDPGAIYVHLWQDGGVVKKTVFHTASGAYTNPQTLISGTCPYAYTVEDTRRNDFNASLSNGNTHSVNLAGNSLANTHFCIDPNNVYTGSPSGWVDYLTTNATYANLNTIINSTAISRVTGSSNAEKVKNLCKILYAWSGVTNRAGSSVSTTYSEARLQQYVWYLLSIDGYGSYNITPPTYTPNRYLKGTATTFNNVTCNGKRLSNNSKVQIPNSGDFIINIGGNFNNTNYEAVVSGGNGKITARIGGSNLYISVDPTATASDINSFSITLKNKVDLKADGSAFTAADIEEYYGFSVANQNNAQQRRVTAYYYNTQPYYNASITLGLEATQSIRLTKASSNPNCTNGNANYSLAGTQYKGYYNLNDARANTNSFITLYSDANGKVGAIDGLDKYIDVTLNGGLGTVAFGDTFYIKEVAVGKGYELDTNIYEVKVSNNPNTAPTVRVLNSNGQATTGTITSTGSNGLYTIPMTNEPVLDPFTFTLTKEDNFGLITNASLVSAKYRLEVYTEELGINSSVSGLTPKVTYEFTPVYDTSSGKAVAKVDLAYLVNNGTVVQGDGNYLRNIYNSSLAEKEFPLGTYRLYESVAPKGYEVSNQVLRFRIYYDASILDARREYKVEGTDQYGQNTFTHRVDPTDPDGLLITQAEHPVFGYYRLTKSLQDTNVLESPVNRFTYDLKNTTTGDIIATGTIPATINGDPNTTGMILWHYDANRDYYDPTNPSANLKNTYTTRVVLPVYNVSNGDQVKIQYEVREYIPNGSLYYAGNSNIPYTYTTPTGWTGSASTYYRHTFTLNEGTTGTAPFTENVQNNIEFASVRIQKGKPAGDLLDLTKVSFTLYRRANGNRIAIATGTVDSNGSITWTRTPGSGLGITTGAESNLTSINELKYLPLGDYRVEESWDKQYINGLDADAQKVVEYFIENTSNRWTRTETDTKVNCYFDFSLTTDGQVENLGNTSDDPTVVNNIVSQWLSMNKVVTVAGDASTVEFQIYYVNPDNGNRTLVAKASAQTNGVGTYPVTFTDSTAPRRNDNKEINLPQGQYYIVEAAPNTTYVRKNGTTTNIPYSYTAPADENGNKWSIHWADDAQITADYYYRTITLGNSDTSVKLAVASNTRIESSLEIRKMYEGTLPDASFDFEVYYRGNKAAPENVGVFEEQYLMETITVNCADGSGKSERLEKLPEGWYEIREVNATNWKIAWSGKGEVTGNNTKIVRANANKLTNATITISDGINLFGENIAGVLGTNTIQIKVDLHKLDRWTRALVHDATQHPDGVHLTFHLYKDGNGNGILDGNEAEQCIATTDVNDDGMVAFKDVGMGSYIIREVVTINGYYLAEDTIAFTVTTPENVVFDETTDKNIANQPYTAPLTVTKLDNETEEPLSGAQFDVYVDSNGNGKYDAGVDAKADAWVDNNGNNLIEPDEIVALEMVENATNKGVYESNGQLHWNDGSAEFGTQYILVETNAPDNYFFVSEDGTITDKNTEVVFKIDAADTTAPNFTVAPIEKTIKNQTGTVYVYKIDKDGNFMEGCTFKVYTNADLTDEFATLTMDATDKVYKYKGLGLGTYYLVETDCPDNMETDPNVYEFTISTDAVHAVIDNSAWIAQNEYTGVTGKFMNYVDVKTNLTDKETQEHIATVDDTITLVDVVAYKGLHVGEEYELKGYLYDTKTGEKYLDKNGEPVTATRTFTPETSVGTVELEFTFDYAYDVVTTVAYEYIYRDGKLVGSHTDITDLDQQVKFPSIHTTLVDTITEEHVAQQRGEMTLVDTVAYENLLVGKNYKMTGVLMIKGTGEPLLDADGNEITAFTTFTPETENGTVDVTFTFEASTVKDITLVAFETLTIIKADTTEKKVVDHKDINDVDQTVNVPEIRTTFYDVDLADAPEMAKQNKTVDLTDTVAYSNITPNLTYTLFARVMVKETGEPFKDAEGNDIVKSVTFTPTSENGTVDVVFEDIDTTLVAGKTLVCFETLSYKNIDLVIHADLEDEDQTVHVPEIHTTAVSDKTGEHVMPEDEEVTVIDTVAYENLIVGKEYRLEGKLVNQETDKPLVDAEGNVVTGETVFTPETPNGTVDVVFTFDATLLRGTTYVVFEDLYYNEVKVVAHADIEDEEQTIDFPEIHTTLLDEVTDDHVAQQRGKITLIDTVAYTHLTVGNEYVMHGTLMNAETGEPMLDSNGNKITAEKKFTPDEKDGFVEIVFTFDAELLTGETTVAFEELTRKDITVATHNDLTDRDQTVDIPEIHTTFFDKNLAEVEDFDQTVVGKEVKLTDTVAYENLTLLDKDGNKIEYTLRGTVMIKETNEPLKDADGNIVEFTKTFVPTESTGTVDVEFTVDTTELQGKTLVAFETLSYKGIDLVIHADIEDEAQTVHVPEIKTKATDKVDGDNIIDGAKTEQTIVDTVSYTNLVPGKTYVMTGKLAVKKDYKEGEEIEFVTDASGKVIEVSVEFVPEKADGTVDVEFVVDASKYAGKKLVAFEKLTYEGIELTTHTDIEDKEQTIVVSLILHVQIAKADKDNIAYYLKDAEITIFYAEKGEDGEYLKDADGNIIYKVAKDVNGNDCVAVTDENGNVDFSIFYDENVTFFAKETKAPAGYQLCDDYFEITPDENRESLGTCLIKINILDAIIIIPPKTGDNINIGLLATIAVLASIGMLGAVVILRKKKGSKTE